MLMKTDSLGIPRFSNKDLIDMIYSGHIDKCHVVLCDPDDDVYKFNKAMREEGLTELTTYIPLDVDQKTFDGACQGEWFMPDEYKQLNVLNWLEAKLMEKMQKANLGYLAVSLGFYKTLFSAPGLSTSSEIPENERSKMGLSNGLVRISIGLDNNIERTYDSIRKCLQEIGIL